MTTVKVYIIGGDGTQKGAWAIHKVYSMSLEMIPSLFLNRSRLVPECYGRDDWSSGCSQAEVIISPYLIPANAQL